MSPASRRQTAVGAGGGSYLVATLVVTGEQTHGFVEVLAARRRVQARAAAERHVAHLRTPEVTLLRTGVKVRSAASTPPESMPAARHQRANICTVGVL